MQFTLESASRSTHEAGGTEHEAGTGSPLRILHTVSTLQVGGMEQFAVRIAAAQRERGHDVALLALAGGPLAAEAERLRVPTTILSGPHKAIRFALGLATMLTFRPHVVHAHNPTSLHYARVGKRAAGACVLMTDHGQGRGSARQPSAEEWNDTDAIVAVSDDVARRRNIDLIREKTVVIRNGIEPTTATRSRAAVREELGIAEETVVPIIVARIDGRKGHSTLLRALARRAPGGPATTTLIAGDGAQRPEMEALAQELGLDAGRVRFLGFRTDTADLLAASDLFVLPSLSEGLPLSILEGMAQRLPVIATPVGGVPEVVIPGETGILAPVDDVDAWAAAIDRLARDPAQRHALAAAGYRRAITEFSFAEMVRGYEALYQGLRAGRSPRSVTTPPPQSTGCRQHS
jgi:glycosyltransferase involved in cell wall biosynthesis